MHRILIIRAGALGDTILLFPALAALRRRFPAARVEAIGYPPTLDLAVRAGLVDHVRSIDDASLASLFSGAGGLPRDSGLPSYIAGFDLIVAYFSDPDSELRQALRGLAPDSCVLVAEPLPPACVHAADWYVTPLQCLGVTASHGAFRMVLPRVEREEARSSLRLKGCSPPVVAVHAGSGGTRKCWPASRFAQLIEGIASRGLKPALISGPADVETSQAVMRLVAGSSELCHFDNLSLPRLAGILSVCNAYVGNDSGVTHLAALVGCPTLAVFGPTDPAMWGPRGPHVKILQDKEGWVGVDTVVSSVLGNLKSEDARCNC